MPGHSRSKARRALHAYVPGIHVFGMAIVEDVDGTCNSGLPELHNLIIRRSGKPICGDKPGHDDSEIKCGAAMAVGASIPGSLRK
jgi:hypothetical protein